MKSPSLKLALRLLLVATLSLPSLAQDSELDLLIREEVTRVEGQDVALLWERAIALRQAEDLGAEGDLDKALDRVLGQTDLAPRGALLAAAARMQGIAPDVALLASALRPLLVAGDPLVGVGAAGLLGKDIFRRLPLKDRQDLGSDLIAAARDLDRSPRDRMAFARACARVGRGTEMRQARDEMRAFLGSADPELRSLGALALAGTGVEITGPLERELERLRDLPDQRGTLAAAYLKQEAIRALHERKYSDLRKQLQERDLPDHLQRFDAVQQMVLNYHLERDHVDRDELLRAALDGMLRHMDEHSSYFDPQSYAKFLLDLEAEYGGIGAYVGIDPGDRLFTINRPIYSGPAYRAGLHTDDKVVRINAWPTLGEPIDDVIKRLKGKPGTAVKLYVWRRGMDPDLIERPDEEMAVTLTREAIQIPAVARQSLPAGIGIIELTTFSRGVADELRATLVQLQDQGMRALLLDLRRNSGGLLAEARNVADLFLPRGKKVVTTQGTLGSPETLRTLEDAALPEDMPIVVLTSRFTASASEIVAGALKDHERAIILGETSFGKGSVQQLLPVLGVREDEYEDQNGNQRWDTWERVLVDYDNDGEVDYRPRVKMTIARYLLPSGRSIHRELDEDGNVLSEGGVVPNVEVKLPLIEGWRVAERQQIRADSGIKEYVTDLWTEHFDLLADLAETDAKDETRYPNFDRLMVNLQTTLPRQDVRMLVRAEVRRRVQDIRGAEYPIGDFQEDYQIQRAIDVALGSFDESALTYPAYSATFLDPDTVAQDRLAVVAPRNRDRVRDAETLIREIRDAGSLPTREQLDEVLDLLGVPAKQD